MQRSLVLFENGIKSKTTLKQYRYNLKRFFDWSKVKDYDSLVKMPDDQLQTLLEDYLFYLKEKVSPNSIAPIFAALELFFTLNDKECKFKKLHKMYPATVKKTGSNAYTTKDVQEMLINVTRKRSRALVLFLASTGVRIGVFEDLKLRHMTEMPNGCKGVLFYEGTNEEYWGFLTPEAAKALNDYLEERRKDGENLNPDSPIFRSDYLLGSLPAKTLTVFGARGIIRRLVGSAVNRTKMGRRYDKQTDHAFRKRFNTTLKLNQNINSNIAEKLLGHKNGLDGVYFTPTKEALFGEFVKAIPELTISEEMRQKATIENLEKKLSEHGTKDVEFEKIKEDFQKDHQMLQDLTRSIESLLNIPDKSGASTLGYYLEKIRISPRPVRANLGRYGD